MGTDKCSMYSCLLLSICLIRVFRDIRDIRDIRGLFFRFMLSSGPFLYRLTDLQDSLLP